MDLLADTDAVVAEAEALAMALQSRGWRMATAESCTGGLIAAVCTSLAGSSEWFDRGFVTYSNEAKTEQLGVDPGLLATHGAVSEAVAVAMARGARLRSSANVSIAVTGIAGPGGATPGKPVGTVWLGWSRCVAGEERAAALQLALAGDRTAVRTGSVRAALHRLVELCRES